ncbi:MAG: DsbA family protein [Methanobacteriota archaeon]
MGRTIEVVHATSPLCSASWGYSAVIDRLEMVYGKQIETVVIQAVPWTDLRQWLKDYAMSAPEAIEYQHEIVAATKVPTRIPSTWDGFPDTCLPAALAVKAAGIVSGPRAERALQRALMAALFVDGHDTASEDVLRDVISAQGLHVESLLKTVEGDDAMKALEDDNVRGGPGANFHSLVVRDGERTTVALERAYEPSRVEAAVDYVASTMGRKLKKRRPVDVESYVALRGPVATLEVARMFAVSEAEAKKKLAALEKKGGIERSDVAGVGRFWTTRRGRLRRMLYSRREEHDPASRDLAGIPVADRVPVLLVGHEEELEVRLCLE